VQSEGIEEEEAQAETAEDPLDALKAWAERHNRRNARS
jgi:hypothetical protein